MNIFYLDNDVSLCSVYHCDKHVVKMILEYTQMLSTRNRLLPDIDIEYLNNIGLPKITHINHPCNIWVRSTTSNYIWLYNLLKTLHGEYTYRYEKIHSYYKYLDVLYVKSIGDQFTNPPKCMPDVYKVDDVVKSYRNYYINDKIRFVKYTKRDFPYWLKSNI